ncbi:MAG: glycosyltransferase family 4 protein, partial [Caulobacteraceae bacterium]
MTGQAPRTLLTFCPLPHNGTGVAQSCVEILANTPPRLFSTRLMTPRTRRRVPRGVSLTQTLPPLVRSLPWRWVRPLGASSLLRRFEEAIDAADPERSVAYFWPQPPVELVNRAKSRGFFTVREMTNCTRTAAKSILDRAYESLGMAPNHGISQESCELENRELDAYDAIFASPQVVPTLAEVGIGPERVLTTSFGWSPTRFAPTVRPQRNERFTAVFAGTLCVRKGVPWLIEAWRRSEVEGELLIAGKVRPEMAPFLAACRGDRSIRFLDYVRNLAALYRRAHCFVFPSFVEGGPQVTYEAAACELPIITTPM